MPPPSDIVPVLAGTPASPSRLTLSPLHSGADIKGAQTVRFRLSNSPTRLVSAVAIIYRRAAGVGCFELPFALKGSGPNADRGS
jgi:hypothetical protein